MKFPSVGVGGAWRGSITNTEGAPRRSHLTIDKSTDTRGTMNRAERRLAERRGDSRASASSRDVIDWVPPQTIPKGDQGGVCNRGACVDGLAIAFNRGTGRWYCTPCAWRINEANREPGVDPLCHVPDRQDLVDAVTRDTAKPEFNQPCLCGHAMSPSFACSLTPEHVGPCVGRRTPGYVHVP